MTNEKIKKIRLLSSKKRLEDNNRYKLTNEENVELNKLREEFELLDNSVGKAIFFMHNFLGISFIDISNILHYSYGAIRTRYYEIKSILLS